MAKGRNLRKDIPRTESGCGYRIYLYRLHCRQGTRKCQWGCKKGESKAVGRTKGGLNTKIHTLTDALGNPLEFLLTAGDVNDSTVAAELLSRRDLSESNVLGDKAYGTAQILDYIQQADGEYTIPPKSNTVRR